jgi:ATP phosphoribosyltransferase regulatory subunit
MPIQRPHFPDLLFDQTVRFRAWERSLSELFVARDYREICPSLVMEKMREDAVRCIDGDRVVSLRWDFTEALATLLASRFEPPPGRVSYRGAVFRRPVHDWEPVERFEVGVESISSAGGSRAADRELLQLLLEVPARVGLQGAVLQLGSAALLALPLQQEAIAGTMAQDVATWLSKRAPHRVHDALNAHSACARLVRHTECLLSGEVEKSPYAGLLEQAREELAETESVARAAMAGGAAISLKIDTADVAGFGFYTGPTLRLWAPHAAFELGAGGRYDGLYPSLGKPWRAAGFCIRLARLLDLADAHPELFAS